MARYQAALGRRRGGGRERPRRLRARAAARRSVEIAYADLVERPAGQIARAPSAVCAAWSSASRSYPKAGSRSERCSKSAATRRRESPPIARGLAHSPRRGSSTPRSASCWRSRRDPEREEHLRARRRAPAAGPGERGPRPRAGGDPARATGTSAERSARRRARGERRDASAWTLLAAVPRSSGRTTTRSAPTTTRPRADPRHCRRSSTARCCCAGSVDSPRARRSSRRCWRSTPDTPRRTSSSESSPLAPLGDGAPRAITSSARSRRAIPTERRSVARCRSSQEVVAARESAAGRGHSSRDRTAGAALELGVAAERRRVPFFHGAVGPGHAHGPRPCHRPPSPNRTRGSLAAGVAAVDAHAAQQRRAPSSNDELDGRRPAPRAAATARAGRRRATDARSRLVEQQAHRAQVVGHHQVDVAVVVDVAHDRRRGSPRTARARGRPPPPSPRRRSGRRRRLRRCGRADCARAAGRDRRRAPAPRSS